MILIVDDSTTNQVLLEAILQEEGYETRTAFSVNEAFRLMEKNPPKLVLLDLLMPEISGFQFLEEVKENDEYAHIPIIVVSAIGTEDTIDICMKLGAADFVSKPINMSEFLGKVKKFILN